jgi:Flp pilus assembly protein TadG
MRNFNMKKFLQRFNKNNKGNAAIEFSLILPLMCALFFGTAEITQGQLIAKKLDKAVRVATDLPGHNSTLEGRAEIEEIMEAAAQAITPFNPALVQFAIAGVQINADGSNRVMWSGARGGATAPACGSSLTIPQDLMPQNKTSRFLIYGEGGYRYTPAVSWFTQGSVDYTTKSFWPARHNQEVRFLPPQC